jgi:hypothetical protein
MTHYCLLHYTDDWMVTGQYYENGVHEMEIAVRI